MRKKKALQHHTILQIRTDLIDAAARHLPAPFSGPNCPRTHVVVKALSDIIEKNGVNVDKEFPTRYIPPPRPGAKRIKRNGSEPASAE